MGPSLARRRSLAPTRAADELGLTVTNDEVHILDLQATSLHCLGFDHAKLTYRHMGRDFRLTDVAGKVVRKKLA